MRATVTSFSSARVEHGGLVLVAALAGLAA
jgi:hypothetical protein